MTYKQGRYNLSATIFVPFDCDNNCPFCTSKADYKNNEDFSLENVLDAIRLLNHKNEIKEFVITGGEPFADIQGLKQIVNCCEKPVYINTTLPIKTFEQAKEIINSTDKIKGVNISRHIEYEFKNVASIEQIDQIEKPVRINCVIPNTYMLKHNLLNFINKYGKKNRDINLRKDYTKTTKENLKDFDSLFRWLATAFDYIETESCMVCNTDYFSVEDKFICAYHRGLQYSAVTVVGKCYVNDVIVSQNGNIYKDWNKTMDLDFLEWLQDNDTKQP